MINQMYYTGDLWMFTVYRYLKVLFENVGTKM